MNQELVIRIEAWKLEGLRIMQELNNIEDSTEVNDAQDLIINGLGISAMAEVFNANKDD